VTRAPGGIERIGLLGGTFDPPHLGHLILASVAADALSLDAVWFVPAADPPHKQGRRLTAIVHRLEMLRLALADNPAFLISRLDVDRPGPHYSVEMVALARAQRPEAVWFFLMGEDSLRDLPHWHQPERLLTLCDLAVLRRPGVSVDMIELSARLSGITDHVTFLDGPGVMISATEIGERVRAGRTIRYLTPDPVREYIATWRLYQDFVAEE